MTKKVFKIETEEKKKYKLLLEDWAILGKRYMELQKKYNKIPKEKENIAKLFFILKKHEKEINLLISCVNNLGERIGTFEQNDDKRR